MKAIVISGCKDCPYLIETDPLANLGGCKLYEFMFEGKVPTTPHPNCKLNDLPTDEEIEKSISRDAIGHEPTFYRKGANFIIERIKK